MATQIDAFLARMRQRPAKVKWSISWKGEKSSPSRRKREPDRVDLAEELAVALFLAAAVTSERAQELRTETVGLREPFQAAGIPTPKGVSMLSRANSDEAPR